MQQSGAAVRVAQRSGRACGHLQALIGYVAKGTGCMFVDFMLCKDCAISSRHGAPEERHPFLIRLRSPLLIEPLQ
jgi:hypothetical protein